MSPSPLIDRRQLDFLLHEVHDAGALCRYPRYAGHSRETFEVVLKAAHGLALAKFADHDRASDAGCHRARHSSGNALSLVPAA